jgi:LEA14-like dessication related protein
MSILTVYKVMMVKELAKRCILWNWMVAFLAIVLLQSCHKPDQDIVLRHVKDVVADATSEPTLRAEAVFFNPNNMGGKLKNIDVEIFVNGKKAGTVDKAYTIRIPAKGEFSVPLEVKLNMKELGTLDTILGMLGGKKFDIKYVGNLRLSYRGFPVKVPIDHKSQIRVTF